MAGRDIYPHVGLEVRHGAGDFVTGHGTRQASAPCPDVKCSEDHVLARTASVTPKGIDQAVHFGLVGNQHLAQDA